MNSNSPKNKEELFNLRHAQARNCVERIFGVFKKRFPILSKPNEYPYPTQVKLVLALAALHNFIRSRSGHRETEWWEQLEDKQKDKYSQKESENIDSIDIQSTEYLVTHGLDDIDMRVFRDTLAQRMWTDYIHYMLGIPRMPTHKAHAQTPAYQSVKRIRSTKDTSRSSLR